MIDRRLIENSASIVPPLGYYIATVKGYWLGRACPVCGDILTQEDIHIHLVREKSNWNDVKQ